MSPSADRLAPEDGLLTQEEQDLLRRVERSKVWRLQRDAMCLEREELFNGTSSIQGLSGQPTTNEALWMNRGAILLLQHYLREGPRFVVWYQRHVAEQAEKRAAARGTVKAPEREYSPQPGFDEQPDFDL